MKQTNNCQVASIYEMRYNITCITNYEFKIKIYLGCAKCQIGLFYLSRMFTMSNCTKSFTVRWNWNQGVLSFYTWLYITDKLDATSINCPKKSLSLDIMFPNYPWHHFFIIINVIYKLMKYYTSTFLLYYVFIFCNALLIFVMLHVIILLIFYF